MDLFSDNELFLLALEENEDAKNVLFTRYKYIIDILMKKYVVVANHFGIDKKDLYAEGLFGFSDALARVDHSFLHRLIFHAKDFQIVHNYNQENKNPNLIYS